MRDLRIEGHNRTPFYLRSRRGLVAVYCGVFEDPSEGAQRRGGPLRHLYRIVFHQRDIWPDYEGKGDDELCADIYEHWLAGEPFRYGRTWR